MVRFLLLDTFVHINRIYYSFKFVHKKLFFINFTIIRIMIVLCLNNTKTINRNINNGAPISTTSPNITEPINGIMDNQTVHRPLQAVHPKKNIFVSRLAYDTTSVDVDFYISYTIDRNIDISSRNFNLLHPGPLLRLKYPLHTLISISLWNPISGQLII